MSRNLTTESSCSSNDELRKKNIRYRHKFLESFVLDVDDRAQEGHLVSNPVQHNDLDKRLLSGLRMAQQEKKKLSHIAPLLVMLLQSGAKWNSDVLLDEQKTPCHIICESPGDHHELLDLMIKSSQQTIIDTQDNRRRTAVMYAVQNANINCLKCLIANGADVNIECGKYQQWCPIIEAIHKLGYGYAHTSDNVYADIFDLLLDSVVKVNKSSLEYDTSPITVAVDLQNVYCIKKLINRGADLDIINSRLCYVWSDIAEMGDVELLKCMIDNGIHKDSTDEHSVSVLWCVVGSGSVEAVRYLLNLGVVIPTNTPEARETQCRQCNEKKLVVDDIIWEDPINKDPCMRAICDNKLEMVKLLDKHGSQCCKLFNTLRHAVISGNVDVTSYLLNKYTYPLNVEYTNESDQSGCEQGYTLLTELNSTHPTDSNLLQITKLLLKNGADPAKTICLATGANAIMTAIHYRHLEVIVQYIRRGVNINFRSYDYTYGIVFPFELSVLDGYHNVAEMLLITGCCYGMFSLDYKHKFKNNLKPDVEKLMVEWKVQENNVTPLKLRCRSVILSHLYPQVDMKIEKLPLPRLFIKFLNFGELDDIIDRFKIELRH